MMRFLDPTNDMAFKRVFGTQGHKHLLISFLNTILQRNHENERITDLDFLPQEEVPPLDGHRRAILDVRCQDAQGNQFIVEMQNRKVPEFLKRVQYYASQSYASQLGKGSSHLELKPIVLVAICNFIFFDDEPTKPISYHKTLNTQTQAHHLKEIAYVFVELGKFKKEAQELKTLEDQWLFFLKNASDLKEIPASVQAKEVQEAFDTLEQFSWSKGEYEAYIKATLSVAEGYAELEEATQKGREEERRDIALKLQAKGLSVEEIIEITGYRFPK